MSGVEDKLEDLTGRPKVQEDGGGWRRLCARWDALGTGGGVFGTSGGSGLRSLWWGLAAIAVFVGAVNANNVISELHNWPKLAPIEPIIWEGSSWFTFVLAAVIPWAALRLAHFSVRPRWRLFAIHLPALVVFSGLHVAGFIAIRQAAYVAAGAHYRTGLMAAFPFEFRKDILGYTLAVLAFWVTARMTQPVQGPSGAAGGEGLFDIRDGARLIRVRLAEILAVTSAGNYVEFVLEDGRRPLMRTPLSAMEEELTPRGFVRTHRSWLVNGAKVSGLAPEGSGDYRIELGELAVPLSRRFPKALAALRGEAATSPRA